MRRLTVLLTIVAGFAFAAPAQAANSPTDDYCDASLHGQTSLAPDNDIKREWDGIELYEGLNIVRTIRSGVFRVAYNDVYEGFTFVRANGAYYPKKAWYRCWRDTAGVYHDEFQYWTY